MARRVTERTYNSIDREKLKIITVYEEGIGKRALKQMEPYKTRNQVLVKSGQTYDFLEKRA